jgi:predicted PurR-regulated permease PerM
MMFLCLVCTVFFLVVLILRSLYTSILLEVGKYVTKLLFLNKKIEELEQKQQNQSGFSNIQSDKLQTSKNKVEGEVEDTKVVMKKLKSVENDIKAIRGLGIISFYLILVVSGFYFSWWAATFILAFGVFAYIYPEYIKNRLYQPLRRIGIRTR